MSPDQIHERHQAMSAHVYHPDPEINAEIAFETLDAERADLALGYPPRRWICDCGASHQRGHLSDIGVHRCLSCGYVGTGGVMTDRRGQEGEFPAGDIA